LSYAVINIYMKKCYICCINKILEDFYKNTRSKDGKMSFCKSCDKLKRKKYYVKNAKSIIEKAKTYNSTYINENRQILSKHYFRKRYNNDALFKIRCLVRNNANRAFKYLLKERNTPSLELLGCDSWDVLKSHIEKQFQKDMTWNNHGPSGWHIDHIIPLSSAKTPEHIIQLCHYTNLQPLWAKDNLQKSNKLPR
jgi:hypothetical protein